MTVQPTVFTALGDLVEDIVVHLQSAVNPATDTPSTIVRRRGGSAANVAVYAAGLGHRARFLGQVGDDATGDALLSEMIATGVDVGSVRRSGTTGTIVALVDRDGERSMLTDRRSCIDLADPQPSWLDGARTLHVPLYSLAVGAVATTATTVIGWAHERSIDVSIDLSSSAVIGELGVERVRHLLDELRPAVVLANIDEAHLLGIDRPIGNAITVVKRGAEPATIHVPGDEPVDVAAATLDDVDDTTGAGDGFAAGFLTAPWRHDPVAACVEGHRCAAALLRRRPGP